MSTNLLDPGGGGGGGSTDDGSTDDGGSSGGSTDDGGDGGVELPSFEDWAPDWLLSLETLAQVEVLGVKLRNNPVGFVIATIVAWFLETTFGILNAIEEILLETGSSTTESIRASGASVLSSFGIVGEILLSALTQLDFLLYDVAFNTGPAALVMIPIVLFGVVIGAAFAIRAIFTLWSWIP